MALCTSNINSSTVMVVVATSVIWMLLIVSADAARRGADNDECPTGLVYPYWSTCSNPATYIYEEGEYQLVGVSDGLQLAPEWDEANSTYYVRLADDGAKYAFTHSTKDLRSAVALSHDVIIENVDTGRRLGWRQEGEDEYFLIEAGADDQAARFQFSIAENVALPCPLIYPPPKCEAYSILKYSTSQGLSSYEEDGATYFKLSDKASATSFVLLRSSSSSSSSVVGSIKMPTTAS